MGMNARPQRALPPSTPPEQMGREAYWNASLTQVVPKKKTCTSLFVPPSRATRLKQSRGGHGRRELYSKHL